MSLHPTSRPNQKVFTNPADGIAHVATEFARFSENGYYRKLVVLIKPIFTTDTLEEGETDTKDIRIVVDPRSRQLRKQHRRIHRRWPDPARDHDSTPEMEVLPAPPPESRSSPPAPSRPAEPETEETPAEPVRKTRRRTYCAMSCRIR